MADVKFKCINTHCKLLLTKCNLRRISITPIQIFARTNVIFFYFKHYKSMQEGKIFTYLYCW